jgi:hypothetical protein
MRSPRKERERPSVCWEALATFGIASIQGRDGGKTPGYLRRSSRRGKIDLLLPVLYPVFRYQSSRAALLLIRMAEMRVETLFTESKHFFMSLIANNVLYKIVSREICQQIFFS